MHNLPITALAVCFAIPTASAWGVLGHATVASIADNYLTPAGRTYVASILGKGISMPSVSSWADDYRSTTAGKFSAPFHYIDAQDIPPDSCNVDLPRDCESNGCLVSAIANYTARVQDTTLSTLDRKQALEFLIHFIGDITQPLHDEAEALGGNQIDVTWDGKATNLHSCWDTQMVEKAAGGKNSTATLDSWGNDLITQIDSGIYASEASSWTSCNDIDTASDCALEWARDGNALICVYVLKVDEANQELDGTYYDGAKPYIEMQIAKGGYRLAAWLNALAAAAAA